MEYKELLSKVQEYRYNLQISFLIKDTNIEEKLETEYMGFLSVEHDYVKNVFPVIKLDVVLSYYLYDMIISKRNEVLIKVILTNSTIKEDNNGQGVQEKNVPNVIIEDIFVPVIEDITPIRDQNVENNEEYNPNNPPSRLLNTIPTSLYLFKKESLELNDCVYNFIMEEATVLHSLSYLFNNSDMKKLLIEKPHNSKIYNQIINPPLNLNNSIKFLQDSYGIYSSGIKFYIDLNRSYLLSRDILYAPREKDELEYVILYIDSLQNDSSGRDLAFYNKSENVQYVLTTNACQFKDRKDLTQKIVGGNIRIIDCYTVENNDIVNYDENNGTFSFNKFITNIDTEDTDKTRVLINDNKTQASTNIVEREMELSELEITLPLVNTDIKYFTPNRKFILNFLEDDIANKYGGVYYLDKFAYTIKKQDELTFTMVAYCLFKRFRGN